MEGLTDWTADGQTDRPFQSMSNRSHSNWNLIPILPDCSFSPQLHRPVTAPSSELKPTTTPWELFARPGLLDIISLVFHRARLLCTITWLTEWTAAQTEQEHEFLTELWIFLSSWRRKDAGEWVRKWVIWKVGIADLLEFISPRFCTSLLWFHFPGNRTRLLLFAHYGH